MFWWKSATTLTRCCCRASKKVVYSPDWKDGQPVSRNGSTQCFKYIRLESYEDTLDGLELTPPSDKQRSLLAGNAGLAEDYRLRYSLGEETSESACLLGKHFTDPFAYTLSVVRDGVRRETPVDLPETFNFLIGLRVESRRRSAGVLAISGTDAQGRKCLILWRNLNETDNTALEAWFARNRAQFPDPLDLVYVNGDHTLNALKQPNESWNAASIEPIFRELMFGGGKRDVHGINAICPPIISRFSQRFRYSLPCRNRCGSEKFQKICDSEKSGMQLMLSSMLRHRIRSRNRQTTFDDPVREFVSAHGEDFQSCRVED